jgi:hypothetical protein
MGLCAKCSSLTCGQHGHRDPAPSFLCIQCDSTLQAGSAGWIGWLRRSGSSSSRGTGGAGTGSGGQGDDALAAVLRDLTGASRASTFSSLDDWMRRRPGYERLIELVLQDIENMLSRFARVADGDGLIVRVETPEDGAELARFAILWRDLDDDGRRLLAAAFVVAQVMNLPRSSLPPVLQSIARITGVPLREEFPEPGQEIPFEEFRYR